MTRQLTNSDYDHVGMVLTFVEDEDIYILEATSEGVHIVWWSDLARFKDQYYSKIVWRRLYWKRDDEFCEILQTFVEAVEDKKYEISIGKLLRKVSLMPNETQKNSSEKLIEENRTFFCSELIAKAFKTLGIFISDKSSASIYPWHFSSKKNLELTDAALGEELLITYF